MNAVQATRLTSRQADNLVDSIVERLRRSGVLPPDARFDAAAFHALRVRVRATFDVPETSVTPVMARLLFALGSALRPRRQLVVGSYCGNTLVWLAGWSILGDHGDAEAVGCDIDEAACRIARANFHRLGGNGRAVAIEVADGHEVLNAPGPPWDLVLLDADAPGERKAIYESLLDAALPRLRPGSVVLAHDTAHPRFAADLAGYLSRTRDRSVFAAGVHLPVDVCGLELSVVGQKSPETRNR